MYEELTHLRVSADAEVPYVYKRLDTQTHLPVEDRTYQLRIPVPGSKGVRKSLKTSDRTTAIEKSEEEVLQLRVLLRQGGSPNKVSVLELVKKFLKTKEVRIRGEWEGKEDRGDKSITQGRYELVRGKLSNYFIRFLGEKTDVRTIPLSVWNEWETWRINNNTRKELGTPSSDTIKNEMGIIREIWKWGIENSYLPNTPKLPFHDENLTPNDKVRRDSWEPHEWKIFSRRVREWVRSLKGSQEEVWDSWISYQMMFFLANCGMRPGEVCKIRRKDVEFYIRNNQDHKFKNLCCLVQVHKSTKTGSRQVNAMGGSFLKRVFDKSKHKKKSDFVFCHLDGTPLTTSEFRNQFYKMTKFTNEDERLGKRLTPYALRHLYYTIRRYNGTTIEGLSKNMGSDYTYLKKHYDHTENRLDTENLTRMNNALGLGGKFIPEGEDFMVPEEI
ncbi:site-specific integrase [Synechococcus sp. M16CYN]|uniref:site-specific integrase n=1 Tax=Synechococcus sp. M16CYN TaxID=3103139 RepID=UPI0030E24A7D